MKNKVAQENIYCGDSLRVRIKDYKPFPQTVPYGTNVQGIYFDGYPQLIKQEGSQPIYRVKAEKDIMVPLRDGVRLAVDIYRPDIEEKKFPAILAMGWQGKELQEMVRWWPKPQPYYDSLFGTA
jgi:predicted acyl esterase